MLYLREPLVELRLKDNSIASVWSLTRSLAREFKDDLARIHNYIPFQNWTGDEIVADQLRGRTFPGKWRLSHIAAMEGKIVALNLAFERKGSSDPYREDCIYMHRFSVLPMYRNRWLGRLFHAYAIDTCFKHVPRVLKAPSPPIYGQTQATLRNAHILKFYTIGCGFRPVGFMYYNNKVDVTIRLSRNAFYRSPHWLLFRERRRYIK